MNKKDITTLLIALAIIIIFAVGLITSFYFLIVIMNKFIFWLITTILMFGR